MPSEREVAFSQYWEGKKGRKLTTQVVKDAYCAGWSDNPAPFKVPIELDGVLEQMTSGAGVWKSCSGCHELNEGHPTGPWSPYLQCNLGGGCHECGGIGAIWDNVDYSDFGKEG